MTPPGAEDALVATADERIRRQVPPVTALERDFPAGALSQIAENESWRKEIHRPATSTHKWWAKRLGSVFRGILTAAVTEHGEDALRAYGSATRLHGLTIFDPFAGSGTTVVEALKLGASVVGFDINPVATLVQRQAVQRWDPSELQRAYKLVEQSCRPEIDRIHCTVNGETVLYYFWVAVANCACCGARTRLFSTHVFAQHAYPKRVPTARIVCPVCLDLIVGQYDFDDVACGNGHKVARRGAVSRTTMTCPAGHVTNVVDALAGRPPQYEVYAKLVLTADGKKHYQPINDFDRSLYSECSDLLHEHGSRLVLPVGSLEDGENTRQAIRWGFNHWWQFFNDRQLYSLGLLGAAVRNVDAGAAEREALIALFSGTLEFNNMFCSFKGEGTGAVRHMFSHHVLKPERTPLEAHPWGTSSSSGAFSTLFKSRLLRAQAYKSAPVDQILGRKEVRRVVGISLPTEASIVDAWPAGGLEPGKVYLHTTDSARTDLPAESVDLIVTDPPYVDNVHYSQLADFFHSWLCGLGPFGHYPRGETTTRRTDEVQNGSSASFEAAITRVWRECARVLKPSGLLAFTFHQARLSGWIALVRSLAGANLVVTAIQAVKGEMSTSITKSGGEPSNLDAVVICRHRDNATTGAPLDPEEAASLGERRLIELRSAGVDVGAGDIRSVIRGQVLASYTAAPDTIDLTALAATADKLATERVARLCGTSHTTR